MKMSRFDILDDVDIAVTESLVKAGVNRNVALVLVYLTETREASSRDIEIGTGLRQPETCIAVNYMVSKGWVTARQVEPIGKGRPSLLYKMNMEIDSILNHYVQSAFDRYNYEAKCLKSASVRLKNRQPIETGVN